jgi:phosphopantothenoylcysteine decarboxylase/phosphopantothenate--cysteine ligase
MDFITVRDLQKMAPKAKADIIIVPAAISDFTLPAKKGKLPSEKGQSIRLEPAPKILGMFGKKAFLVGFKAETGITRKALEERARSRMKAHALKMIVANLLEDVKADETKAMLIRPGKKPLEFRGSKSMLAEVIFDTILEG